jgi:hypothetical protein
LFAVGFRFVRFAVWFLAVCCTVGVGSNVTAVCKFSPPCRPCVPAPVPALACGVTTSSSSPDRFGFNAFRRSGCDAPLPAPSRAVGVGSDDEQSCSSVGGANVGSSYNRPRRVIPEDGKVGEDKVESPSKVNCDVLQHDDPGS